MVILLLVVGLGVFVTVWGGFLAQKSQTQPFTPHYLKYNGVKTQIYIASQTSSYEYANQTYVSNDGVTVAKGSGVFTINLALHNDYSSDNPPPNSGMAVAPVDGTTYIRIQPILFDNTGKLIPTVNVSLYDFPSPAGQTGIVLSSGQDLQVHLVLATYQNMVASYTVNLVSITDSIPR
jgi:hypothetical protein